MAKMEKSIVAYKDDKSLYASDSRALKEQRRGDRQKQRHERRIIRAYKKREKRANKRAKKEDWKRTKKQLWNQAHSQNHYDEAEYHLMNTRVSYSERDIQRYNKKLQKRNYRKLVRQERRFR